MRPGFMLAERGRVADLDRLAGRGFAFELKVDGIRALADVRGGRATLTSRNDLSLDRRFPELVDALASVDGLTAVLDTEISVSGSDGLPSWALTLSRTQQAVPTRQMLRDNPARLYVFDVLALDGADLRSTPLAERRRALEVLAERFPANVGLTPLADEPAELWDFVVAHRLEGVMAKRLSSLYRPGRSHDWVKIKAVQSVSCLVGGVDYAPDVPDEPRSLQLFLVDEHDGELVPIGKASAGVAPAVKAQIRAGLKQPPLIVEVEYSDVTATRTLRHPVLRRVRTDLDVLDCSTSQLT